MFWIGGSEFQVEVLMFQLVSLEGLEFLDVGLLFHLARKEGSKLQSAGPHLVAALRRIRGAWPALEERCNTTLIIQSV